MTPELRDILLIIITEFYALLVYPSLCCKAQYVAIQQKQSVLGLYEPKRKNFPMRPIKKALSLCRATLVGIKSV